VRRVNTAGGLLRGRYWGVICDLDHGGDLVVGRGPQASNNLRPNCLSFCPPIQLCFIATVVSNYPYPLITLIPKKGFNSVTPSAIFLQFYASRKIKSHCARIQLSLHVISKGVLELNPLHGCHGS